MEEKWMMAAKRADFNKIAAKYHIDPVTARLIRNRDIITDDEIQKYLYGNKEDLYVPELMKGIPEAVDVLQKKVSLGSYIRIIGDYDIDGVMSTYILLSSLRKLGAKVDMMIPNRITDGYGINIELVRQAKEAGVDTILTCDNGIAAREQSAYAKEMGMTVIVTDHHEVPYDEQEDGTKEYLLPPADVIVNPKQPQDTYPFRELCGAAVAYKLMTALYEKSGRIQEADELLEYAAFATIGDVMDLVGENRIIVKEGLEQLRHTKNLGLEELMKINGIAPDKLTPYHIGFVLGPCMNASGRLDTAKRSLELLLSQSREQAARLAGDLKDLNDSRKALTQEGMEEAFELIEHSELSEDNVLVVYLPNCHESLAGIIAGRVRERYHKPAFVLTNGEDGNVKGSGRSTENYSMFQEMSKCKDLFLKFGGHPMAAGLSVIKDNIEPLRKTLNKNCSLTKDDLIPRVSIDVPMPISYVREDLIREFGILEPYGKGNTKPVFAQNDLLVDGIRVLGKNRNVVKMRLTDYQTSMDGIYFGDVEKFIEEIHNGQTISITYYPDINEYNGNRSLQIVVTHYRKR